MAQTRSGASSSRRELATAAVAAIMDVNPFDEPNVQQAKVPHARRSSRLRARVTFLQANGEPFTFGILELAQALCDMASLEQAGRRALHVHLPRQMPIRSGASSTGC